MTVRLNAVETAALAGIDEAVIVEAQAGTSP